jgi:hypothetical protein
MAEWGKWDVDTGVNYKCSENIVRVTGSA